jgi:hypothetical protein
MVAPRTGADGQITCGLRGKTNFITSFSMFVAFKPLRENNSLFRKRKSGVWFALSRPARGALRPIVT